MNSVINKATVLVLNRNWQAINIRTPAEAFCQMATGAATALEIQGDDHMRPVSWDEWVQLPIRKQDQAVQTVRGPIRMPTVIVLANFARVPKKRPKLCPKTIRERDGNKCQYTGRMLKPEEGSIDHVVPRSRGGKDAWENCVWASKAVNSKKGNRLPHEAGLKLLRLPKALREMPVTALIRNVHGITDWEPFIRETKDLD
jgi:5-methylcytosine-specific restriction endonuclease McrA